MGVLCGWNVSGPSRSLKPRGRHLKQTTALKSRPRRRGKKRAATNRFATASTMPSAVADARGILFQFFLPIPFVPDSLLSYGVSDIRDLRPRFGFRLIRGLRLGKGKGGVARDKTEHGRKPERFFEGRAECRARLPHGHRRGNRHGPEADVPMGEEEMDDEDRQEEPPEVRVVLIEMQVS